MTPREEQKLLTKILELEEQLAELQSAASRHSVGARTLGADLRRSQSEIGVHVDDTVGAIARRDANLIAALNEVRGAIQAIRDDTKPAAEAAQAAENAAVLAVGHTKSVADDTDTIAKDQKRALVWWRHPAAVFFLYAALEWIAKHV